MAAKVRRSSHLPLARSRPEIALESLTSPTRRSTTTRSRRATVSSQATRSSSSSTSRATPRARREATGASLAAEASSSLSTTLRSSRQWRTVEEGTSSLTELRRCNRSRCVARKTAPSRVALTPSPSSLDRRSTCSSRRRALAAGVQQRAAAHVSRARVFAVAQVRQVPSFPSPLLRCLRSRSVRDAC